MEWELLEQLAEQRQKDRDCPSSCEAQAITRSCPRLGSTLTVNFRQIQQYLGHRSLQTTTLYLHLTSHGQEHAVATLEALMH